MPNSSLEKVGPPERQTARHASLQAAKRFKLHLRKYERLPEIFQREILEHPWEDALLPQLQSRPPHNAGEIGVL